MSLYPCLTWVRRGKAKANPEKVQIAAEDLKKFIDETQERLEEEEEGEEIEKDDEENVENIDTTDNNEVEMAVEAAKAVKGGKGKIDGEDIDSKYNLDNYDEEDTDLGNPLKGIGNLTVHARNDEDPFITLKEDEDSDREDDEIKDTDNLLLVGKADKEYCSLEVHVYNSELANFYVHHEILLSSFPLAVEWLDFDVTQEKPGNLVAVATMDPTIDLWDIDLVDSLEPLATLGERPKKKKKKAAFQCHTDAVLDLSWNTNARHVLASASADNTVGLWDLMEGKMAMAVKHHTDKVQCVKWHPVEEHMLLSGSFDKTVKMYDCRSPDTNFKSWSLSGEVEKILWNHFSPINFFATTDTGHVYYMDSRQDTPIFTLSAHTDGVTGLSLSSEKANLMVTTSTDQMLKIWETSDNKPSLVHSKKIPLGQLHCSANCPDAPYVFAMSGDKGVKVLDVRQNADVYNHFCFDGTNPHIGDEGGDKGDKAVEETQESGEEMETEGAVTAGPGQGKYRKKKKKKRKPRN